MKTDRLNFICILLAIILVIAAFLLGSPVGIGKTLRIGDYDPPRSRSPYQTSNSQRETETHRSETTRKAESTEQETTYSSETLKSQLSSAPIFYGIPRSNQNNNRNGSSSSNDETLEPEIKYILNTESGVFHKSTCGTGQNIDPSHRVYTDESRSEIIAKGYRPCGNCGP